MATTAQLGTRQMIRLDTAMYARLKRVAERESKRGMAKVNPTDVMRKFIVDGLEKWERENPQAPLKGSGIR